MNRTDALYIGIGDVGAFLHDITKLSCEFELSTARNVLSLYGQYITTH